MARMCRLVSTSRQGPSTLTMREIGLTSELQVSRGPSPHPAVLCQIILHMVLWLPPQPALNTAPPNHQASACSMVTDLPPSTGMQI